MALWPGPEMELLVMVSVLPTDPELNPVRWPNVAPEDRAVGSYPGPAPQGSFDQIIQVPNAAALREHELNCNECLDKMAEFAERELAGKAVPDALEAVQHHLSICGECSEEYESPLTALQHLKEDESRSE